MSTPLSEVGTRLRVDAGALRTVGLVALLLVVVVAYWPTVVSIAQMWSLSSFRHSWLVPFVSAFLFVRNYAAFAGTSWRASTVGLVAVAACVWLWLVARATLVQAAEHVAVFCLLSSIVWAVTGTQAYRTIAFPLGYLVFALPVGTSVVPALMQITADTASAGLGFIGIPVYREGMLMVLPGGAFEVADVCSGFRFLFSGLALGTLVAYLLFKSNLRRAVFVAVVGAAFVLTNGVRAFIVMAVASTTDMRYLAGQDHVIFGWVLFLAVMVGLYVLAERFSDERRGK